MTLSAPWPPHKREEFLRNLQNPLSTETIEFQGLLQNLNVFLIPIELPVYRLENGRTIDRQEEFIAKNSKQLNFFSQDVESWEALEAQDGILRAMLGEAGLLRYFRKHAQSEPLILTRDGRVVNGNRRLCAMRKLLDEDAEKYAHFKHIRVATLPQCVSKDIDELEARLQLHEHIRAEYSWTTEALILRTKQQLYKLSLSEVASMYDLSEKNARQKLEMLADADRYLASRDRPRLYSELRKKEFAFRRLCSERQKITDPAQADLFTELVFLLIDRPVVDARQYQRIPLILKELPHFQKAVSAEFVPVNSPDPPIQNSPTTEDEALLIRDEGQTNDQIQLIKVVSDPGNRERLGVVVRDVVESAEARKRQEEAENECLDNVANAATSLENAINCLNDESNIAGIETHLNNIEASIEKIRTKIAEYAED
jgi:hypothetical protein